MLDYLFTAHYLDGTSHRQTQEDRSLTREGGSAYTDVRQEELHSFSLEHCETGDTWKVDLTDGHFEHNGVPFDLGEPFDWDGKPLRLVYWRVNTRTFSMDLAELSHHVAYRIGWQANDKKGKNYQQTVTVS